MEKYRLALPWVARHDMNFLMFCYSSFPASGKDWRSDYTADEQAGFRELAAQADKLGVELCLSFNPGIWSKPPLTYASEEDYQLALRKVKQVHALGIRSFALCLDDINTQLQPADAEKFKTLEAAQVYFINRLWKDMKSLSPRPRRLIFCPSAYTTADARKHLDYIRKIAELDREIDVFWTGPVVCSPTITAKDAEIFARWIGRKPIVWDNYPVNDMFPWRPLMAPVKGRSADLGGAVAGLMANPMKQWEASKIPLATLATYLRDPAGYDPSRALHDTIAAEYPPDQRDAVWALIGVYGTSFLGEAHYPPKPGCADSLRALRESFEKVPELAKLWADVQPTVESDIKSASP
jgi:hyaluronoglucosaminidase